MTRKYGFLNGYFRKPGYLSDQKGIALVAGLALMVVLTVLSFVAIQYASVDIKRTKDYTKTRQAVHIAEAGIHRALNYFNYDASGNSPGEVSNGFDDLIALSTISSDRMVPKLETLEPKNVFITELIPKNSLSPAPCESIQFGIIKISFS